MPLQQKPRPRAAEQAPTDEAAKRERYKRHLDRLLDNALEETFPASDPIAVTPRRLKAPPAAQLAEPRNG